MEAGESGTRQSFFPPRAIQDPYRPHRPDLTTTSSLDSRVRDPPKMAAATLINPAPAYHQPPPPQSSPFPHPYHSQPPPPQPQQHPPPPAMASTSSLVSHGESRRSSHETEPPTTQRQSLPSISDIFTLGSKQSPYSQHQTAPPTPSGSQGLPPPFANAAPPRTEPPAEPRPTPTHDDGYFRYGPRPETSTPTHHPAPNSPYRYPDGQRSLPKPPEPMPVNSAHANPPPPPPPSYPPGQYPLTQGPISPPPFSHPYDQQQQQPPPPPPPPQQHRPPIYNDEEFAHRQRYDNSTLNRHFEAWGYQEILHKLSWNARTVFSFAEAYHKVAQEQHGGPPIPERLPSEKEVSDMISQVGFMKSSLESVREIVQSSIANERAREGVRPKGPYENDDDVSMYGSDGMKQTYGLGEVKKRRGRAAPPGRCHSCNRIDTPEWRRGPDGARTLCNACGLHYAKLERKRQMEQRSIRPKAVDERGP